MTRIEKQHFVKEVKKHKTIKQITRKIKKTQRKKFQLLPKEKRIQNNSRMYNKNYKQKDV